MTASASPRHGSEDHSLARGASTEAILAALLPEDREEFRVALRAALGEASTTLELAPVYDTLEEWRRRAILQSDPAAFHQAVRRVAEVRTGDPVPDDEPFPVTRARAGM